MTVKKTTTRKRVAKKKVATKQPEDTSSADINFQVPVDPKELRRRWENARRVVSEAVGQTDNHDPRIWERGVYQLWLWLVIERLVVRRDELDVGELSVISKMLHDQRKLTLDEAKHQQKTGDNNSNGAAKPTQLPEHFGELVRQIYGTNFQATDADADEK